MRETDLLSVCVCPTCMSARPPGGAAAARRPGCPPACPGTANSATGYNAANTCVYTYHVSLYNIYIYICIHMYIYIYIERERDIYII